ncbi:MAG: AAA family ATPase [Opitutales bacterium]|nr:AAA family ATPase [Opitutales bacterium]
MSTDVFRDRIYDLPPGPSEPMLKRTWSTDNPAEFAMIMFTIQRFCEERANFWILHEKETIEFSPAPSESRPVMTEGLAIFTLRDQQFCIESADGMRSRSVTLRSDKRAEWFFEELAKELREKNPWRGQLLELTVKDGHISAAPRAPHSETLDTVVMASEMRNDIRENTVDRLRFGLGSGAILHGPPGSGKSITCRSLLNEAVAAGFTAAYACGRLDFDEFAVLRRKYFGELFLVLEDVEMYAEDRVNGIKSYFSDFLQFTSGIEESAHPMVVVVTTNHLHLLDRAIRNRPVRFNRKWHFGVPDTDTIEQLLAAFLPKGVPLRETAAVCLERGFNGAHIREVRDTAAIICKKRGVPAPEAVREAIDIVARHFPTDHGPAGFMS